MNVLVALVQSLRARALAARCCSVANRVALLIMSTCGGLSVMTEVGDGGREQALHAALCARQSSGKARRHSAGCSHNAYVTWAECSDVLCTCFAALRP